MIALKYSDIAAFRFPREKKVLTEKTLEREEEKKNTTEGVYKRKYIIKREKERVRKRE